MDVVQRNRTGPVCANHPGETPEHVAVETLLVRSGLRAGWDAVPEQPGRAVPG